MDTFEYKPMSEEGKVLNDEIKAKAVELMELFEKAVSKEERSEASRLMNIARTNLEQTVMWAIKAVTRK